MHRNFSSLFIVVKARILDVNLFLLNSPLQEGEKCHLKQCSGLKPALNLRGIPINLYSSELIGTFASKKLIGINLCFKMLFYFLKSMLKLSSN